ncbi:MAG TPA: FkbM family methyltransferase [Mucilaginibacter sp.]
MKKILSIFIKLTSKIIGRKNLEKFLIHSAKSLDINLHVHGLIQNGGLSSYKVQSNGERVFVEKVLLGLNKTAIKPVFFDVGANVGEYSLVLREYFPNAEIYSFEPVKNTFEKLAENTVNSHINLHNIGFSDKVGTGEIFNTVNSDNTEVASVYKDVFSGVFHDHNELVPMEFQMDTIDNFCRLNNITNIDFLKIDVEGHELSVLKGAENMLLNGQIKIIQFEINTHNVYSRVFLNDFYQILSDFEFYRILPDELIKIGPYNPQNEIFTLQNIVAFRKDAGYFIKAKSLNGL